jgi:hypothetical protein
MAMFNDIVSFPGGKMARGKNYYRTPAVVGGKLLNFKSAFVNEHVSFQYVKGIK